MTHTEPHTAVNGLRARVKRAETTSAFGAGILGAGIALLLARWVQPFAVPLLFLGVVMHAWGMYDKHRLDAGSDSIRIWWVEALYWGCWIALVALGIYVVVSR